LPQAEKVIKSSFIKIAQTFLEVLYTPVLTSKNIGHYVTVENEHYIKETLAEGKGIIALNAHFGNWEWMGAAMALCGYPAVAIIKPQPNAQHTELINEFRRKAGIEVLTRGSEVVGAIKALKQGKMVSFFSDQDAGRHGVFVKFFEKMDATPQGAAVFAKKLKQPVVPIFMVRCPKAGHRLIVERPMYYKDTGSEAQDMKNFISNMTKVIENRIRQYPDEWIWFLKRWRTEYVDQGERMGE
jgi:KDO2-lipid IV(A) lauroyltransferase